MNKTTKIVIMVLLFLSVGTFGWGVAEIARCKTEGFGFLATGVIIAGIIGGISDSNLKL